MKIIVCLDKRGGMLFNHRRQSRDRVVTEDIFADFEQIYCSEYSKELFNNRAIRPFSDLSEQKTSSAVCFVEDEKSSNLFALTDSITIYRWDKIYPADTFFDFDLSAFKLVKKTELKGFSHDIIVKEIYAK